MIKLSPKVALYTTVAPVILGAALASSPAFAQDEPAPVIATPSAAAVSGNDDGIIIVTGSRMRADDQDTPFTLNVLTREDRVLAGVRSTSDLLQGATITSGASQINGAFLGFVGEGGPAAETIGLRGLNASRTLVLLNGRRLSPAGAGPKLIAADLNVLPTAIVKRVEILREGASSVYGSDAIAGVVNVITDTRFEGVSFDLFTNQPIEHGGGGRDYRASVTAGHVFDRGHITASFEYRERTGLRIGDRKDTSCPRDLVFDPTTGAEIGGIDPATGQLACFPYSLNAGVGLASGYGIASNLFNGANDRVAYVDGDINQTRTINGIDRTSPNPVQLRNHVISPVRTYTGYLNGAYELDALGSAEIYAEALFTRRESRQERAYQLNLVNPNQLSPNIEIFGFPLGFFGLPTSPFFPNSLTFDPQGYNLFLPFIVPDRPIEQSQRVDYVRANGGLRGDLGIGDWRYDANFQYSHTRARSSDLRVESALFDNALQTTLAPPGTPSDLITVALPGQAGSGLSFTCASNVSGGQIVSGADCVPINLYDPAILVDGHLPENVFNYLFRQQIGHTTFDQTTIAFNFGGTLVELPAGPLRAAIGYEHRNDKINDVPSLAGQANGIYNFTSSGVTRGSDRVDEVYGELGIPILADRQFARLLELNLSGRYTNYKSYGSDFTYHINAQWAPNEFIRFRGNYGTSFRAPNLFEQFVGDQIGFLGGGVDPCNLFGQTRAPTDTVYQNCLAELTPILGAAGALNYFAISGPRAITRGGGDRLKAETSTSWGLGAILTVSPGDVDLSFSVDYWNITVKDEVFILNNLILNRCYEAEDFPNNEYCDLIGPRLQGPAAGPFSGTLDFFVNPYLNIARQKVSGIDFDLLMGTEIAGGKFALKATATRNIHQQFQLFEGAPLQEFNGTLGTQGFGAGPKWVADMNVQYTLPSGNITFRYGIKFVGKQDSTDLVGPFVAGLGVGPVDTDFVAEFYWEHAAAIQFRIEDLGEFTLGVRNLFNEKPPTISQIPVSRGRYARIGNYFNSSNYDYVGRSVFLNVSRKFN